MKRSAPFREASVLIVTKNRAPLLRRCLKSLEKQEIQPQQVLIVDNGSTDGTKNVIKEYSERLPIRTVFSGASGYPAVYNAGIHSSSGTWIIFFDDDCVAPPDWSVRMNEAIRKSPHDVIQGKIISTPAGNIYADIMGDHYQNWIRLHTVGPAAMDTFDNKNLCVPAAVLAKYGGFDERLKYGSEDIEMGKRYYNNGVRITYDQAVVAFHQERTDFIGFVRQHSRIAKSEAILDSRLDAREKIGVIKKSKMLLHVKSAFAREVRYLRSGRIAEFFFLPVLYGILAAIRVWTYYTSTWSIKKSA